jgi:hypothetical protein
MQYPLELTFKFWALTPQISVIDAQGNQVFYVRQKLFKLKEVINIFADEQRTQQTHTIKADRIIDFSARYNFYKGDQGPQSKGGAKGGAELGAIKRHGWKSIWKSRYDIFDGETVTFTLQEEDPWVKVFDYLFSEIPVVGWFTGYVFNPSYLVARTDGTPIMRLQKKPTFMSRIFTIEQMGKLDSQEEESILLSLIMMILLERRRG